MHACLFGFSVTKILLEYVSGILMLIELFVNFNLFFYRVLWLCLHKCRKSHVAISEFRAQNSSPKRIHGQQRETKSVQVLLLLIQHGANGLNLLEAQHVVLVEPLLNPAAEAQAVSRVHRIGQEKRTLVHRFIVCSFSFFFLLNWFRMLYTCVSSRLNIAYSRHVFEIHNLNTLKL